ncbi:helix-turn-helix domain-containing protein [Mechercharimyces sp. CAU 1602]|uniref:helix-turn-helix domain-containing protein n=1 Tax=Mechercharimyces sp. CAU 1602 TaxID=2973933 RepID=UPI002163EEAC|nr:helix-turn-helix domain-containing protein [Mechercharimyces sp. CAU 1602]MCS1351216.1 helix-turn-helix domain-containing protein [Mechercharimyces sp. CAU 1602]
MKGLHTKELGELLRRIRKEKSLRLEDIADQNISPATISNIERGVPHVLSGKIEYLMEKLGTDEDEVKRLKAGVAEELKQLELDLLAIESFCDVGEIEEAIEKLNKYDSMSTEHPFAAIVYFLRGKCYVSKGEWEKAKREISSAIRLSGNCHTENIEASSYCLLGIISFFTNELNQAIQFTDKGIQTFVPEGKRSQLLDVLIINKISYLENLNRVGEAFTLVSEIWERKEEIRKPELLLHLYQQRVTLLRKTDHYEEAIEIGTEGLERARMTSEYIRILDLWDAMGSVYLRMDDLENAEVCLDFAVKLKKKINTRHHLYIATLTRCGILYMRKGELERAHLFLEDAIVQGRELKADVYLIDALTIMGDLKVRLGNNNEAILYYQEAIQIAEKCGLKKKKHAILYRLANSYQHVDQKVFQHLLSNMFEVYREMREDGLIRDII